MPIYCFRCSECGRNYELTQREDNVCEYDGEVLTRDYKAENKMVTVEWPTNYKPWRRTYQGREATDEVGRVISGAKEVRNAGDPDQQTVSDNLDDVLK